MKPAKFWQFTVIILVICLPVSAAATIDSKTLDEYLQNAYKEFNTAGLAVGIIQNGKITFTGYYGYADKAEKKPLTGKSIFRIASCTKAFTSAAIGILVDEKKLNWDDKVKDILPDFKLSDPYLTENLTIRDTLTHRAGYKGFDGDLLWYRTGYSSDEVLKRFQKMPLKYGIRTRYGYSNIMFMVAGKVIEKISGRPYADFINERILGPLGMKDSNLKAGMIENNPMLAKPYKGETEIPFVDYDMIAPAGGVNTTVEDSLKWIDMLLNRGQAGDRQILTSNTYFELVSPQFIIPVNGIQRAAGINFNHYALGWYTYEYHGKTVVMHQGGLPGYISEIVLIPSENTGFVIYSNELNLLPMMLVYKLLDETLGIQGQDWAKQGLMYNKMIAEHEKMTEKELLEKQVKGTKPTLNLEDYAGNYHDDMYGDAGVTFRDGALSVQLLPPDGELKSELAHYQDNSFLVKFNDDFIPQGIIKFDLDEKGAIKGFKFEIDIDDFNFENLYFKKTGND